jgi:hypothetical protein
MLNFPYLNTHPNDQGDEIVCMRNHNQYEILYLLLEWKKPICSL